MSPTQELACHIIGVWEPPGEMYSPHFKDETNCGSGIAPGHNAVVPDCTLSLPSPQDNLLHTGLASKGSEG